MYNIQAFSKGNQNILVKKDPSQYTTPNNEQRQYMAKRKRIELRDEQRCLEDSLKEVWDE